MRIAILVVVLFYCISIEGFAGGFDYDSLMAGELKGKLLLQWLEPDLFMFIPDKDTPLSFTRSNGLKITPGRMLTDGGSIPRPVWILRNYSPWGFAPAFIMHDWIFTMKKCKLPGYEEYTLEEAALVMAETMKTMIEQKKVEAGEYTVRAFHAAVVSPIASEFWNKGACSPPPSGMFDKKPILEYEIVF